MFQGDELPKFRLFDNGIGHLMAELVYASIFILIHFWNYEEVRNKI